ncbi:monovalent cation/H+ antiporter subunit A [Bartonella tamiae]|uniref:Monovalent cation:proton antiporter n=1 Tax=Bartonella tamiae Th239 TaxID=1094558 RepID=J1K390_9HYPH|nr:monovalent cation/H+ antiporter subunit A [Bartonella tamiae]EJF91590.1 monovalent cation:proton antiporter [Bartonella tamiae Th239]EJF92426.1 monovalent cation:proton antiporter [Bartonella tamiae Th307]
MTTREAMLILLVILPFVGSAVIGFFRSTAKNNEAWFAGAVALVGLLFTIMLYPAINDGNSVRLDISWLPEWGLNFTLRLDGLAWLFSLLITGIGLLVVVYARYYMDPADPVPRFFSFFLAFMGSMMGMVLSGNIVLLVIFWELTSIFSFLLIGYWYHNSGARDGARMALTITGLGGFTLLVGVLIIGHIVGSYDLDVVLKSGSIIRSSPLYIPALICILLGALTKSAQFPFHFWLPNAMSAPTPVSAYLHSATMVKAGVFLLVRFWPVLAGTEAWFWIVGLAGLTTLLIGAYFAMFQQDLKGLLAYSTISHLGLITTLLSLGSPLACVAAIFHMANHATFKASLFMAAGIIDHETGTRDMRKLSGLFRYMPITGTLALVASAAMAGVPLLNGFLSKEMFFAETVETHMESWLDIATPYIATLASLFSVTYSVRFIHGVFFGAKPRDLPKTPHEPPHFMRFPVEFLVFLCLVVGIFPNFTVGPILHNAVVSVLGAATPHYSLALWHGLDTPLIMSMIAIVGGILLYVFARQYLRSRDDGPLFFKHWKGQRIFDRVLVTISWQWARTAEAFLSTRRLQVQVRWVVLSAILAIILLIWQSGLIHQGSLPLFPLDIPFAIIWIIGASCAIAVAWQAKYHRLASLMFLGGAGLMTCATFLWLSAPDLALTQLVVEVVTTVLLLLGLRWLPKRWQAQEKFSSGFLAIMRRGRDLTIALLGGGGLAWLSYAIMTRPQGQTISDFFLTHAYSDAGGTNVVNVLLVDFRSFDTIGEITVLGIVALTVFALLRRFRPAVESIGAPSQQRLQTAFDAAHPDREVGDTVSDYLIVPSVVMHWLFPVIMALAVYFFVRGHDLPGGGFAAGVTMAIGFIVQYVASGTRWVENHLTVLPLRWIGFGLLMAIATGIGSWLFGYPFLTSYFQYTEIPFVGKMPTATALLFDLGVFSLVVGATVLMLIAIAHQSIRQYRVGKKNIVKLVKEEKR